jgi:hypothetical protein
MENRSIEAIQTDIDWINSEIERLDDTPDDQRGDSFEREWSNALEVLFSLSWELTQVME